MERRTYTPEDLAERWHVHPRTVRRLIASGELAAFRVGALWRIPAEAVAAHENRTAAAAA